MNREKNFHIVFFSLLLTSVLFFILDRIVPGILFLLVMICFISNNNFKPFFNFINGIKSKFFL